MSLRRTGLSLVMLAALAPAARAQSGDADDRSRRRRLGQGEDRARHVRADRHEFAHRHAAPRQAGNYMQERPNRLVDSLHRSRGAIAIVADGRRSGSTCRAARRVRSSSGRRRIASGADRHRRRSFSTDPRSRYDITAAGTATVSGHAAHGLTLVPKNGSQRAFDKATIWVDDDDSHSCEFESSSRAASRGTCASPRSSPTSRSIAPPSRSRRRPESASSSGRASIA